ncbi:MAG: TonB-dependent receptor, partial [Wenzhouxiangella sp.]|nr:TonB-dependent receptor [Wenzhouxiangella sp.]
RGLNDRYSNTLINGSPLASQEPFRRAVPLDLFPTSLINNILIQKTFSPQYPGEFGGGLVQIETTRLPEEGFFEVGVSGAANTVTSFDDGLLHDGGSNDWTGFSDNTRGFDGEFADTFALRNVQRQQLGDIDERSGAVYQAEMIRSLADSELWVIQEGDIGGDIGFSVDGGQRFDFDNFSVGVLSAVSYDNGWETRSGEFNEVDVDAGGIVLSSDQERTTTTNTIELNGMFNLGVESASGDHAVSALALVLRSSDKDTELTSGFDEDDNADVIVGRTGFFERQVYTYQLSGDHLFELGQGLEVDWRGSFSDASRNAPDQRIFKYVEQGAGGPFTLQDEDDTRIRFSRVDEETTEYGIDFTLPVTLFGLDWEWKAGYATLDQERQSVLRELGARRSGLVPDELFAVDTNGDGVLDTGSRVDFVFADQNIPPNRFRFTEVGGLLFPEAFTGTLETEAFYLGTDVQVTPFLRAALGGRFEDGEQTLNTYAAPEFNTVERQDIEAAISEDYFLPAATLTWTFADNLQARFGYSETITRPQFRELGPSLFFNTETGTRFLGNPFLQNTEIQNYDARLEWYFGRQQFLTAGVFYKELENPIVEYVRPDGEGLSTSFVNAPEATLTGFEIEYEQNFDAAEVFGRDGFWSDFELFVKGNFTYTDSEMSAADEDFVLVANFSGGSIINETGDATVDLSDCQGDTPASFCVPAGQLLEDGSRLQGQSEYLANLQLGFENVDTQARTALLLNYTGERIRALSDRSTGAPALFEEPPIMLDLVHSRTFDLNEGGAYDVRFAVRNLLGEEYEAS